MSEKMFERSENFSNKVKRYVKMTFWYFVPENRVIEDEVEAVKLCWKNLNYTTKYTSTDLVRDKLEFLNLSRAGNDEELKNRLTNAKCTLKTLIELSGFLRGRKYEKQEFEELKNRPELGDWSDGYGFTIPVLLEIDGKDVKVLFTEYIETGGW